MKSPRKTTASSPAEKALPELGKRRRLAIVPALDEEESIGGVIEEIRAFDPDFAIVVVDDGSGDRTAEVARSCGVRVLELPFNLGIGGAVQTGYRFAHEQGYELAVQIDGDGQHDPAELPAILAPILAGEADFVVGSRFAEQADGAFRSSFLRRLGGRIFARLVSLIAGQRLTDTTSGFRAVNRRGIALFAAEYPHDYPEVESTVIAAKHRLRIVEVPVRMRGRAGGRSSITPFRSLYYMAKVLLALLVSISRRPVAPVEER
jgi:glycosyltransferase involved in cell wall biosynthesis